MTISLPLDATKISSGDWAEDYTEWIEFEGPQIDINGEGASFESSHGWWGDTGTNGYGGWWWSDYDEDFTFQGIRYDGQAVAVIDADRNNIYDSEVDYVIGYAYGYDNGGNSGVWERTTPTRGSFSGGSFGDFVITVKVESKGTIYSDILVGSTVSDNIKGGRGNDEIHGFNGSDKLYGQSGIDKLYGQSGNDKLYGGSGKDKLYGDSGKDYLKGDSGNDKLYGGSGKDYLNGGSSADKLYGGSGKDRLIGGKSNDRLYGGSSSDKLYGDSGKDYLKGDSGNDKLYGGAGNDTLMGGKGKDDLYGGRGKDIFKLTKGSGHDKIRDFKKREDKIYLGNFKSLRIKDAGKHAKIYSGKDLLAVVYNEDNIIKSGNYLI